MSTAGRTQPNALARESSPYLRQHAHNPVDWLPWGEAALALAQQKDLPILLSIGYSTCHWCHVMAHESFDDPEVAAVMNRHFISIKVDREERPDLDAIYMAAVTAMTGRGGWPLNVFLMPDGTPFFGGTYFPPAHRQGAVSWPMLLERIAELWADPVEREKLTVSAKAITDHVAGQQQIAPTTGSRVVSVGDRMTAARQAFSRRFDTARGGFSPAPKFPMPPVINFMYFDQLAGNQPFGDGRTAESSGQMATETLTAMARGGIFDQFGGGFHRYSVDDRWHLPHFEKMLYDNALLAATYADAAAITNKKAFARVAADTLDYLLRDLRHADGGFFSAEDADSPVPGHPDRPAQEGAFYVWTLDELNAALDPSLAPMVAYRYGILPTGNVRSDPHGEFAEKNIPYQAHRLSDTARIYPETAPHIAESLDQCRAQLLSVRNERPRPHRDEKILTGWNGLAISALAVADARLQRSDYGNAAAVTARFIYTHLYDPSNQMLYRRWYDGDRAIAGMLDDYGYLLQGLLDLFNVDSDPFWLDWALALADGLINRFQNPKSGQLFMTDASVGNDLVVRPTDAVDGVVPAAGGVAAAALIRLSDLMHQAAYAESAHHYISAMSGLIEAEPAAAPTTIMAMALNQWPPFQAFADATRPKAAILARQTLASPIPGQLMVRWHSSEQRQSLANRIPAVHTTATPQAAIVVCSQRICHPPVNRADQLASLIAMEIGDLSGKT